MNSAPSRPDRAGRAASDPVQEFFSIGEVCDLTDLKPHVLRYWESQFRFLSPAKNRSGNRVYQRKEVELIQLVKHLLYVEKYTIEGARRRLDDMKRNAGDELASELDEAKVKDTFETLAADLAGLVAYIDGFRRGEAEPGEPRA